MLKYPLHNRRTATQRRDPSTEPYLALRNSESQFSLHLYGTPHFVSQKMDIRDAFAHTGKSAYLSDRIGCGVKKLLERGGRTVILCDGYANASRLPRIELHGEVCNRELSFSRSLFNHSLLNRKSHTQVVPWDEYHANGTSATPAVGYRRKFDEGIHMHDTSFAEQEIERLVHAFATEIQKDTTPGPCVVRIAAMQFEVSRNLIDGIVCGDLTAYYKIVS